MKIRGRSNYVKVCLLFVGGLIIYFLWSFDRGQIVGIQNNSEDIYHANLKTSAGKNIILNKEKPTIVSFWTTTCTYCHQEMPIFQELYHKYKSKINFLLVNVTALEKDESIPVNFMKNFKYSFPIVLDDSGALSKKYGVIAVPVTFVINNKGKVYYHQIGIVKKNILEQKILGLID